MGLGVVEACSIPNCLKSVREQLCVMVDRKYSDYYWAGMRKSALCIVFDHLYSV